MILKGLFHPACLARVVSWFAFVVAIFMAHQNGDNQRPSKRRHVQGILDETKVFIDANELHCRMIRKTLEISLMSHFVFTLSTDIKYFFILNGCRD